ncbi:MAG: RIP metalloprotease RseP [Rudaea sp.]|uniref:RIP metalloprotease RseP n=1 Tax=Rudaea sp. TaxID=2136325 RepID=UPI0039E308F2
MSEFLGSVFWLAVTLGVLVTFHEFGHYWVARRCGVRVLRFSIGFGKPIASFQRDGTQWAIGAIPLGGYVKFLDQREADDPRAVAGQPGEFYSKPPWQRIAIAAAGPVFNIVFAIAAFWAMFVIGRPDYQPVIGAPKGLAAEAGLVAGDRIVSVGGEKVDSMSAAMLAVTQAAARHRDTSVEVAGANGQIRAATLALSKLPPGAPDNAAVYEKIGINAAPLPAVIGLVDADTPAAKGGLKVGDRILGLNGHAIADSSQVSRLLGEEAAKNPQVSLLVERDGRQIPVAIAAERLTRDGQTRWMLGIAWQERARDALERFGPLAAVPAAFEETWKQTASMLGMIKSMIVGEASVKNLSSVISIAEVANASANEGLAWFLSFLAVISLSLGILNLLPIPILDGGHIVFTLAEWIKGRPVSERTLIAGQYVGLALLASLMGLAFYNDIARKLAQVFGS